MGNSDSKDVEIYDGSVDSGIKKFEPSKTYIDTRDWTKTHLIKPKDIGLSDNDKARVVLINELVKTWDVLIRKIIYTQRHDICKTFTFGNEEHEVLYDPGAFVYSRRTSSMLLDEILCGDERSIHKFKTRVVINNVAQVLQLPLFAKENNCIIDVRFDNYNENYMIISMGDCCYGINSISIQSFPVIIKLNGNNIANIWKKLEYHMEQKRKPTVHIYPFEYTRVLATIKERGLYEVPPSYKWNLVQRAFFECIPGPTGPYHTLVCFGSSKEYKAVITKYKKSTVPVITPMGLTERRLPITKTLSPEILEKIKTGHMSSEDPV